jgi:hypothetical protein
MFLLTCNGFNGRENHVVHADGASICLVGNTSYHDHGRCSNLGSSYTGPLTAYLISSCYILN